MEVEKKEKRRSLSQEVGRTGLRSMRTHAGARARARVCVCVIVHACV